VFGYKKHEERIGLSEHKENNYIGRQKNSMISSASKHNVMSFL